VIDDCGHAFRVAALIVVAMCSAAVTARVVDHLSEPAQWARMGGR
jgi:hypothetical protein